MTDTPDTPEPAWPRTKWQSIGRRVLARRPLTSPFGTIPAGMELTVTGWRGRDMRVESDPCDCCGITASMTQLDPDRDVTLLPPQLGILSDPDREFHVGDTVGPPLPERALPNASVRRYLVTHAWYPPESWGYTLLFCPHTNPPETKG